MKTHCSTRILDKTETTAAATDTNLRSRFLLAAIATASLVATNHASAAATQIEVDEGGFVNWALGAAHQTSGQLTEEANNPSARGLFGPNYVPGSFQISLLRPETVGNTQANTLEVDASLVFTASGTILSGSTQSRGFDILDPVSEGHGLSDTLLWTWSSVGLTNNQVRLSVKFNSDSLTGFITPLTGPGGNFFTENGTNQYMSSEDAFFLPNHPAFAGIAAGDIDIVIRSDVQVPEPSAAAFCMLSVGLCGFARLRARAQASASPSELP